jgi:tetratricopeptide (TPR) repeat protein
MTNVRRQAERSGLAQHTRGIRSRYFACSLAVTALAAPAASADGTAGSERGVDAPAQPDTLPSREVLDRDPAAAGLMLFDLLEQAELAEKQGDAPAAVRYYEAIARAVPERATAFSKLCELYQRLGQREPAIAACYRATGLPGTKVADQLRYAELLLAKPAGQEFRDVEIRELRSTFEHLRGAGAESAQLEILECQLAVVLEDLAAMRTCVERLHATLPPQSPVTLTYEMSLAFFERDFDRARALLAEAPRSGMSGESIALATQELEARERGPRARETTGSLPTLSWAAVFGAALAMIVLAALGARLWRRRAKPA